MLNITEGNKHQAIMERLPFVNLARLAA